MLFPFITFCFLIRSSPEKVYQLSNLLLPFPYQPDISRSQEWIEAVAPLFNHLHKSLIKNDWFSLVGKTAVINRERIK